MHIELIWLRRSGRESSDHPSTLARTDPHLTGLEIPTWASMIGETCGIQMEGAQVAEDKEARELAEDAGPRVESTM